MIDALFNNTNYAVTKKLLDAATLRHEAIAGNLANLETPGYKRVDLSPSFATELQRAAATRDPALIAAVQPKLEGTGAAVELETELTNMQQNTLTHTLGTQLISGALLRLRLAITGRS